MNLLFTGDVAFNDCQISVEQNPLADLLPLIQKADATIISFDSGIGPVIDEIPEHYYISSPIQYMDWLVHLPGLALNLGNNHAFDGGNQAFMVAQQRLSEMGISVFGAGLCITDAIRPLILKTDDASVAILSCATPNCSPIRFADPTHSGPAPFNLSHLQVQAEELHKLYDFVILCIHWGKELIGLPLPEEYLLGQELLSSFDLIVGNHPHVVRGMISRENRQLFFSLGNTLFGNVLRSDGLEVFRQAPLNKIGLILQVQAIRGQPLKVVPIGVKHNGSKVSLDLHSSGIKELDRRSRFFKFSSDIYSLLYRIEEKVFNLWTYRFDFRFRAYGLLESIAYLRSRQRS